MPTKPSKAEFEKALKAFLRSFAETSGVEVNVEVVDLSEDEADKKEDAAAPGTNPNQARKPIGYVLVECHDSGKRRIVHESFDEHEDCVATQLKKFLAEPAAMLLKFMGVTFEIVPVYL